MLKAGLFRPFARRLRPAEPTSRRLNLEPLEGRWVPANVSTSPNQNFVDQVYRDVLHRPPDPGGLAAWTNALNSGQLDREEVVVGILGSPEGLRTQVNDLYLRFLNRPADPTGLAGWTAFLADDHSNLELAAQLIGSAEYFQTQGGGTALGFLNAVYEDVLCRPIGPGEPAFWLDELLNEGPVEVAEDILESDEARTRQVELAFSSYLRRDVPVPVAHDIGEVLDDGELDGAFDDLGDHIDDNDDLLFTALLLSSNEYFQLAQTLTPADFATIPACEPLPGTPAPPI